MVFLGETGSMARSLTSDPGFNLWQTLGGLILVFGLLILCLKLLGKWNRRTSAGESTLLTVWSLGPKREIQVLKLGAEVHYIYRHEGAMVLLKQESLEEWEAQLATPAKPQSAAGWPGLLGQLGARFSRGESDGQLTPNPGRPLRVGDLLP
jgi:hypothetical protein